MKREGLSILLGTIVASLMLCISCKPHRPLPQQQVNRDSITIIDTPDNIIQDLEIPFIESDTPRQIIRREAYTTCYNHDTRCPNWVAWVLTKGKVQAKTDKKIWYDDAGNAIGINNFSPEMIKVTYIYDIEAEVPRPELDDWDDMPVDMSHGHMCPAADCKMSPAAMNQSFLLTNICVQAVKLNTGSWSKLETKCRNLAEKYGCIYIVAGPIFNNGVPTAYMGFNKIAIPDAFFKVLLCMEGTPKAIGFIYTNTNDKHNMQDAVRTVDQIEELTGLDFFPLLPNDVEDVIEGQAKLNEWQ